MLSANTSYLNIYLVPYILVNFEVFSWVFWLQLLPTLEADLLSATVLTNVSEFIDQTCSLGHSLGTKMLVKLNPVEKETERGSEDTRWRAVVAVLADVSEGKP